MANPIKDLTGNRYGRLVVLYRSPIDYCSPRGYTIPKWVCQCDCGNVSTVIGGNLQKGKTSSCGCVRREINSITKTTHGDSRGNRLYRIYNDMINRCNNHNVTHYHRYGGRGIRVCEEWVQSYDRFKEWAVNHGYSDNLTIDRINNDGDYAPLNCRWITQSENSKKSFADRRKKVLANG